MRETSAAAVGGGEGNASRTAEVTGAQGGVDCLAMETLLQKEITGLGSGRSWGILNLMRTDHHSHTLLCSQTRSVRRTIYPGRALIRKVGCSEVMTFEKRNRCLLRFPGAILLRR
jgi:hypothetical protein